MSAKVYFEDDSFRYLHQQIRKARASQLFILADAKTKKHALPLLEQAGIKGQVIYVPAGEESKSIESCLGIWNSLMKHQADRQSLLINVGGGMITDLGGFAASVYKRGIRFIHVPTSLLGMVDAGIGGKTGINVSFLKNNIGNFTEPESIHIYPLFCQTLPQRVYRAGEAEMIKHFLIADRQRFLHFGKESANNLYSSIRQAVKIKQDIVAKDPLDKGYRQVLNAGHTIGHAIETLYLKQKKNILHGEAVASGLYYEAQISKAIGLLPASEWELIETVLLRHFRIHRIADKKQLVSFMLQDKKNKNGRVIMALPERVGRVNPQVELTTDQLVFY